MHRRFRRLQGLALALEIVLGLGLFGVAILFVFRLFPASDAAEIHAERITQATHLARMVLHDQMARAYDEVAPVSGASNTTFATRRGADMILEFNYNVEVNEIGSGAQKLKNVKVKVTWWTGTGTGKISRDIRLETLKGRAL